MQTEIDFIKLEQSIKKALNSNYWKFSENRIIPEISILLDELGIFSFQSDLKYPILLGTTLLLASSILTSEYLKEKRRRVVNDTSIIIQETIRNTQTYKTCIEFYNQYLDKYVNLLDTLGITDSDEVAIIYQFMLDNGLLSYPKNYHYDQEIISKQLHQYIGLYELDELTACKIATGVGVCRHSSSQLTDIQNRVGNPSYNFYIEGLTRPFNAKKYKLRTINHQYTMTKDKDNHYYAYCTTSKSFVKLDYEVKNKYIHATTIPLMESEKEYETIIPLDFNLLIKNNDEIIKDLLYQKQTSYRKMNPMALLYKYDRIKELIIHNTDILEEFYQNTKEDLKKISDSYNCIVPSHDKIKSLKIR